MLGPKTTSDKDASQKFYACIVYVWKGHHVLNMKSSVRLPSAGAILLVLTAAGNSSMTRPLRTSVTSGPQASGTTLRPYLLAARKADSQSENRGSIPRRGTIYASVAQLVSAPH